MKPSSARRPKVTTPAAVAAVVLMKSRRVVDMRLHRPRRCPKVSNATARRQHPTEVQLAGRAVGLHPSRSGVGSERSAERQHEPAVADRRLERVPGPLADGAQLGMQADPQRFSSHDPQWQLAARRPFVGEHTKSDNPAGTRSRASCGTRWRSGCHFSARRFTAKAVPSRWRGERFKASLSLAGSCRAAPLEVRLWAPTPAGAIIVNDPSTSSIGQVRIDPPNCNFPSTSPGRGRHSSSLR